MQEYNWSNQLKSNPGLEEVIRRQIIEPNEEDTLKSKIAVLGAITDEVSKRVREQYEENPYPRWVNLGLRLQPSSIAQLRNELKLKFSNDKILSISSPEILIAGCGTGQHSIGTASRFKNSKVLAVDLSMSSLAYA